MSKRLNQAQQRAIKVEEELKIQKVQNEQIKLALKTANERRVSTEESLANTNISILLFGRSVSSGEVLQQEEISFSIAIKELGYSNFWVMEDRRLCRIISSGLATTHLFRMESKRNLFGLDDAIVAIIAASTIIVIITASTVAVVVSAATIAL